MPIKARKCFTPISPSRWVSKVFLTCDNILAVQFRHGQHVKKVLPHGPGAYLGHGGVPHVTCLYPGTQGELAERLYELAQVWSYGGEWVHAFLYKKFGYQLIAPPAECGGCATSCSLSVEPASPNEGDTVTITCTVTNTDGSPAKGDAPQGTVEFYLDGNPLGKGTLPPETEPDSQNRAACSVQWTASCAPEETHSVQAIFVPCEDDFAQCNCSEQVTVQCGIPCSSCPGLVLPKTVYATISNATGCTCLMGTYPLTGQGGAWYYQASSGPCTIHGESQPLTLILTCLNNSGPLGFELTIACGNDFGQYFPSAPWTCEPLLIPFALSWSNATGCCDSSPDGTASADIYISG